MVNPNRILLLGLGWGIPATALAILIELPLVLTGVIVIPPAVVSAHIHKTARAKRSEEQDE